jgi:thioredoxin reductase (NADPH)
MYDIIVIGAGPAGLTAAIYARRALKKVLVLEAKTYGGQIINTQEIENYPATAHISGFDFATNIYNQTIELGAEIVFKRAIDLVDKGNIKEVKTENETYEGKAVIIATGCDNRKLGLENEDNLIGKGISYCAICDGNFYKGKDVAVVGGGNNALEEALYLSNLANCVYLIHRREEFRGDEKTIQKVKEKSNIKIIYNSNVTKLIGNEKIENIEVTNTNRSVSMIPISCLFVAIGKIPENENFAKFIDTNELGYAISDEECKTKTPGIFVAGDNRVKEVRQLVTATSDGAVAACNAIKYINSL